MKQPGRRRGRRLSRRQLITLDVLAAAGYVLIFALAAAARTDIPAAISVPLVVMIGAPVAGRRLAPVPVFLTVFAASVAGAITGVLIDPFVAAAYALYPVAVGSRRGPLPTSVTAVVAGAALLVGSTVGAAPYPAWRRVGLAIVGTGLLAAAWTAGRLVRERREEAARSAAELAARAVAEERLRIARELHDVLAHSMSLIAVKAGTANHVMAVRPQEAKDALAVIESTSRAALVEMRHLLGVLRSDVDSGELAPAPGLPGLPALAERARDAGVTVELDVRDVDDLPEAVAVSVYRIVQEALTNVVRHAGPARATVRVVGQPGQVQVEVVDDGAGQPALPPGHATGHGLIGMRERVLMYGGEFHAGPRPEGGFEVRARIPYAP